MDKDTIRNWRAFESAREKLKDIIDTIDGEAFMAEEIDDSFEQLESGVKQLKEFWEKRLRK